MLKLICFIESLDNILLEHFLSHYDYLGVEQYYFICLEGNKPTLFRDNIHYETISLEQFVNEQKKQNHKRRSCHFVFENNIKKQCVSNNDWCFIADLDEFIHIPNNDIMSIINDKYNVVTGYLVDRLSSDGRITRLIKSIDIDKQFPIKVRLTKYSNRCEKKIFLTKGPRFHQCGHHCLINYSNTNFHPITYQVFHYKWFEQNLKHLHKTYPFNNYFANNEFNYLDNTKFSDVVLQEIQKKYPI